MEQIPHQGGDPQNIQASYVLSHSPEGEPHHAPVPSVPPPEQTPLVLPHEQTPETPDSPDEQAIRQGIEQAQHNNTDIDNRTARYIAAHLHEGQSSALYSLASTGAIPETLSDELIQDFDHQPAHVQNWITWLSMYCLNRENKGPIPGWVASAAIIDQTEEDEQARQALMYRISAASTTTLGHIAIIPTVSDTEHTTPSHILPNTQDNLTPEHTTEGRTADSHHQDDPNGTNHDTEPDVFPWHDAAHWSLTSPRDELARTRLEALFTEIPDQELGTTQHLGWFGLLKHEGRPGGMVLSQNTYGFRHVWETSSDDQLAQQWDQLQCEHDAFMRATRAEQTPTRAPATHADNSSEQRNRNDPTDTSHTDHQHPPETIHAEHSEQTTTTHHPEIWVGSLSDYNDGHLHGTWLDATLDPDDLYLAIQFILRAGHDPTAEEWAIMDYDDFCGLNLGEYESLEVVSSIATGIAEHGEAFAKWVSYVGERSEDLLTDERFQDHYLGHFESTEAYVENLLEETGAYEFEEFVPEWLKPYVKINFEPLARDSEIELYVTDAQDGGVFVFDGRH